MGTFFNVRVQTKLKDFKMIYINLIQLSLKFVEPSRKIINVRSSHENFNILINSLENQAFSGIPCTIWLYIKIEQHNIETDRQKIIQMLGILLNRTCNRNFVMKLHASIH